jgi:hypothetical protein
MKLRELLATWSRPVPKRCEKPSCPGRKTRPAESAKGVK